MVVNMYNYSAIPEEATYRTITERISKKRKSHRTGERFEEQPHDVSKKKKKKYYLCTENNLDINGSKDDANCCNDIAEIPIIKNKKEKFSKLENENKNDVLTDESNRNLQCREQEFENNHLSKSSVSTKYNSKENTIHGGAKDLYKVDNSLNFKERLLKKNTSNENEEYKCKGDLSSHVKRYPIRTNTHEYLTEKKVNIVKIDIIQEPTKQGVNQTCQPVGQKDGETEKRSEELSQINIDICRSGSYSNFPLIAEKSEPAIVKSNKGNFTEGISGNHINSASMKEKNPTIEITSEVDEKLNTVPNRKPKYFFFNSTIQSPGVKDKEVRNVDQHLIENQKHKQRYFTIKSPCITPSLIVEHLNDEESHSATNNKVLDTIKIEKIGSLHANTHEDNDDVNKEESSDSAKLFSTNDSNESNIPHGSISAISGLHDLQSSTSRICTRPKQISGIGMYYFKKHSSSSSNCLSLLHYRLVSVITRRIKHNSKRFLQSDYVL